MGFSQLFQANCSKRRYTERGPVLRCRRCDGTLTEVGRGRVSLHVKGRKKPVTVRGGGAYFAKARLFAARRVT